MINYGLDGEQKAAIEWALEAAKEAYSYENSGDAMNELDSHILAYKNLLGIKENAKHLVP